MIMRGITCRIAGGHKSFINTRIAQNHESKPAGLDLSSQRLFRSYFLDGTEKNTATVETAVYLSSLHATKEAEHSLFGV